MSDSADSEGGDSSGVDASDEAYARAVCRDNVASAYSHGVLEGYPVAAESRSSKDDAGVDAAALKTASEHAAF